MAAIELPTKLSGVAAILWLVDAPGDGWLVLAAYAGAAALATAVSYGVALRRVRPRWPGLARVRETFRLGFSLFLMQISSVMNTAGSAFLLSMLTSPAQVASFAAPDKLARPLAWLTMPVNKALLPRLSHLLVHRPDQARVIARIALLLLAGIGLGFSMLVMLLAPWLIELVFGSGYESATPVLRMLALVIPLLVVNDALAAQWLVPHGLDRPLSLIVLAAAGFGVSLALLIVPTYQALGMAVVVVLVELFILAGLLLTLASHRQRIFVGRPNARVAGQLVASARRS
jgi:O-antigen/teichoic acid export membrane protein